MPLGNEYILDHDIVAARAAHSEGIPGIEDFRLACGQEHEPQQRHALLVDTWRVPIRNLQKEYQPVTMMSAADERPLPCQAVAAVHSDRRATGCKSSAENGIGPAVQNFSRTIARQPGQEGVGTDRDLQIPAGSTVVAGNFLDHAKHGDGIGLQTPERFWTSHAKRPASRMASTTGRERWRCCSASAACWRMIGAIFMAFSTTELSVCMNCHRSPPFFVRTLPSTSVVIISFMFQVPLAEPWLLVGPLWQILR